MTFNTVIVLFILSLFILLVWVLKRLYKYYHMSRALVSYFADQLPDTATLNIWFNWAERCTVRKLLKRSEPPKPARTRNYRAVSVNRVSIDRDVLIAHLSVAFADTTDPADLEIRRRSLRFLRKQLGLEG
jgi:hypothetical protein